MTKSHFIGLFFALVLAGCAAKALPPVEVKMPDHEIDFLTEVKPLLDKRCVVCHSCYNSPCQLKLSSYEGVGRGGSKEAVYNATRLSTMDPTRLFIDAQTTKEWRKKNFFTVTENQAQPGYNNSIMLQLLNHKIKNPVSRGEYHSEANDLTCSETDIELGGYLEKHPNNGMPFGFPPLTDKEFEIISGWLFQGAKGPDTQEQQVLTSSAEVDVAAIQQWEEFLNDSDLKHAMTARYLYEHLFLAHISFGTSSNVYYELIRSRTPTGEPSEIIKTVRPYDPPGVDRFYYRFRKIHSTIVHKTHMVFRLDDAQMARIKELFIEPEWLLKPQLVGYDKELAANPFIAFEQIPPRARYQFLLDNAHYIIMTFIRGPVCRGQVALNVIDDHFWVMFLNPDHDLSVKYPAFLHLQQQNLAMPIEQGSKFPVSNFFKNPYSKKLMTYFNDRQNFYLGHYLYNQGLGYDAIWKGKKPEDAPVLTIYRHFDSASVLKGAVGNLPKTMWVIDYPLLERIYYALVAGFDVYGTFGHQLAIRLYMDTLRVEGQTYFLDFMPQEKRHEMMQSWYQGVKFKDIHTFLGTMSTKIDFKTNNVKQEFIEEIVNNQILPETGITFDPINYNADGIEAPDLTKHNTLDDYLKQLDAALQPPSPLLIHFHGQNTNLAYLRIKRKTGPDFVASMIINRWHNNVTHLFGEDKALNPKKDRVNFVPGFVGSYPNYFFVVEEDDFPHFLNQAASYQDTEEGRGKLKKYAINRADNNFWEHYDWFQEQFNKEQPVHSGLFDLNRYDFVAVPKNIATDTVPSP